MFINFTFFETSNMFVSLLYLNFSPIISKPSSVIALPPLSPTIKFPFSKISISVILKLISSSAIEKFEKLKNKVINISFFKNLFFIYFH